MKNETTVTNGERPKGKGWVLKKGKGWVLKAIKSNKFVWARKVKVIA